MDLRDSRGFSLVEVLIGVAIALIVGFFCVRLASSVLSALRTSTARFAGSATLSALQQRWLDEEDDAWAIFTPPTDTNGTSNADGHEVDFFNRDIKHQPQFWAYTYDAAAQTVTRYTYSSVGGAPTPDETYAGVTSFYAQTYPLTALQDATSRIYSPLYQTANLQNGAVHFFSTTAPWIAGGNQITYVRVTTAHGVREMHLSTWTAPSGWTVVLKYTPRPISTPTPKPGLNVWPAAVRYGISGTNVADAGAPAVTVASLLNAVLGGGVAYAAVTCPAVAYPSSAAMANNQPYSQGTTDPYGQGITIGANGCYGGQIVVSESGYSGVFLDKGLSVSACTSAQVVAGGWNPTTYGPTAYQSFSGGGQSTSSCALGFSDGSSTPNTALVQAQVYGCGPAVNEPNNSTAQDCLWYGATASGGPGIGIVGQAEVWYYDTAASTGPVMDCSDPSTGCTWNQNGAIAYCAQPIDPSTGAPTGPPIIESNSAGFNCSSVYTTKPPAQKWSTIPCQGTKIQCRNQPGSGGPNLP